MAPPRKYKSEEERRRANADKARQKRASMTAEERQQFLDRIRENKKRKMGIMNEAERKEYIRKRNEAQKKWYASKSEKCRQKEGESERRRANSKLANMTEEEKQEKKRIRREEERHRKYFRNQAWLAKMTKDEREEYNRKNREYQRKKKSKKTEEQKKAESQKHYFYEQARLARMTPEEREEWTRNKADWHRRWRENLTGEKLERYKESMRRSAKKLIKSEKFKSSKMYQKMLEYQRRRTATETPEERQKRLRRYKINQAVRKLRMELGNEGLPPEEIEERAMELKERMWAEPLPPPEEISSYSRRPKQGRRLRQQSNPSPPESRSINFFIADLTPPETISNFTTSETTRLGQHLNPSLTETVHSSTVIADCDSPAENKKPEHCHADQEDEENSCNDDNYDYAFASEDNIELDVDVDSVEGLSTPQEGGTPVSISVPSLEDIKCPHCSSHFSHKSDLTTHIICEHPKKCWKCPMCKQLMISAAELKEHFKTGCEHAARIASTASSKSMNNNNKSGGSGRGSDKIFTCMKCDPLAPDLERTFTTPNYLREHVKLKHSESYWPCSKCDILKYSERALRTHEKICRSQKRIKVKSNKQFNS